MERNSLYLFIDYFMESDLRKNKIWSPRPNQPLTRSKILIRTWKLQILARFSALSDMLHKKKDTFPHTHFFMNQYMKITVFVEEYSLYFPWYFSSTNHSLIFLELNKIYFILFWTSKIMTKLNLVSSVDFFYKICIP